MTDKNLLTMRNMSIAGLVAGILVASFIPVYTDEIGWRFQERAGFDGVDKLFSDICGTNTLAAPPFFMWPARYFSSIFNGMFADPAWVRVSGIVYALGIAWLLVALIGRMADGARERNLLTAFGVGLAALGMLPMLLAWSRPEQPILLATLGALLLANAGRPRPEIRTPPAAAWLRATAVLALWVIAVSYHLKGLFLFPVFAACLWFCAHGRQTVLPRAAIGLAGLIVTALAAQYWLGRMACPDSAILRAAFAQNSIGAEIGAVASLGDAWNLLLAMLGNVTLLGYVVHTVPNEFPLSYWLPARQIGESASFAWFLATVVLWGAALIAGFVGLRAVIVRAVRQREVDRRIVLALATAITIVGWSASQNWRNVYEAPFVVLLIVIALLFVLAASGIAARGGKVLAATAALFALLGYLNPLALGMLWGPAMAQAWSQAGYVKEQPYSVALRGYSQVREEIMATAKLCQLPPPEAASGVLVDEVTYFAYMQSRLPQHRLGVLSVWNGEIDDPVTYLESRKSDGLLLGCHLLKGDLRQRVKQNGRFCCLRLEGDKE